VDNVEERICSQSLALFLVDDDKRTLLHGHGLVWLIVIWIMDTAWCMKKWKMNV